MSTGAGLIPLSHTHYIDHLAVICIIMNAPMLFLSEEEYELAAKYYPGLKAKLVDYQELTPEYLIANYDVLYMSDIWNRDVFRRQYQLLEQKYQKILRYVYCPHGFSDKGFYLKHAASEDITLVYGQNMLDLLQECGTIKNLKTYVTVGNYRYTYYKEHQEQLKKVFEEEISQKFVKKQPTLLYAPTWKDEEEASTFFDLHAYVLDRLPSHYNMIVRLHPHLEYNDIARYYNVVGKYEDRPNIVFTKDFTPVYPVLDYVDAYIGDTSSIGYDFLTFGKPLFFLNKDSRNSSNDRRAFLFRCGVEIMPESFANLYNIIDKSIQNKDDPFAQLKKDVYQYTFGNEQSFFNIKKQIFEAVQTPY